MRLNIFKVNIDVAPSLTVELENSGYLPEAHKEIGEYSLTLYLRKKETKNRGWVDFYKEMLSDDVLSEYTSDIFSDNVSGALLLKSNTACFIIAHGQSHFLIRKYCDRDFGLNLAERIANETGLKMKHSQTFSSSGKKDITSYSIKQNLDNSYEYGEAFNYIKCKTIDKTQWGDTVDFGESACFTVGKYLSGNIKDIVELVDRIEATLEKDSLFSIPRYRNVKDKALVDKLDAELSRHFLEYVSRVETEDYWLTGVSFNFGSEARYRIKFKGSELSEIRESLNAEDVRSIIETNRDRIKDRIDLIKVEFIDDENDTLIYSKPLKESMQISLEYNGHYYVLYYNEWVEFSESYIKFIQDQVDEIHVCFVDSMGLGETDLIAEYAKKPQYTQLHKRNKYVGKYCIEQADLMDDDNVIMIKDERTTSDLVYLIKQATTSVRLTRTGELADNVFNGRSVCLWMLLKRGELTKLSDLKSFHLLDALYDFKREMKSKDLDPVVWISLSK